NTAVIGEAITDPAHNPACGAPWVVDYTSSPGRYCVDAHFYDRTNRVGPIIPVNRSASGTRTNDLLLALYQFGAKLKDPLSGALLTNTVAWPYQPVRYLTVWPANPDNIYIAGGQGSGPVPLADPNWSVYRQPNSNQPGYNPNEEHAFRFTAGPAPLRLKVGVSAAMVAQGGSVPVEISLVGDPANAPQSAVTVTVAGARVGDTNLFVIFPTNPQQLLFTTTNWQTPQTITLRAASGFITGSNSFDVRATGDLISQATLSAFEAVTNQPGLTIDALAFELP